MRGRQVRVRTTPDRTTRAGQGHWRQLLHETRAVAERSDLRVRGVLYGQVAGQLLPESLIRFIATRFSTGGSWRTP